MTAGPTARQLQVHEAVVRHGGSHAAAGRELGITGTAVGFSETRYLIAIGELPRSNRLRSSREPRLSKSAVVALLPGRVEALEGLVEDVRGEVQALQALIESLLHRQPLILEVRPGHQRKADGGAGGRREASATRRAIRGEVA